MAKHHDAIDVTSGDDWIIHGTLLDDDGVSPLDLTDATLIWSLVSPDGVFLEDVVTATSIVPETPLTTGIVIITVPYTQTAYLPAGRYHDALRVIAGGRSKMWWGTLLVACDPWDEDLLPD